MHAQKSRCARKFYYSNKQIRAKVHWSLSRLTEEPASIIQPGWSFACHDPSGRGLNRVSIIASPHWRDRMRKITITVAALALIALTTSFAPYPWSGSPSRTLASISPSDLTLAAKNLPSADHTDAH
jgi:hypothetical protein